MKTRSILVLIARLVPSHMVYRGERGATTTRELSEIDIRRDIPEGDLLPGGPRIWQRAIESMGA